MPRLIANKVRGRRSKDLRFKEPTSEAQLEIMRSAVKENCEDRPGVYRMVSQEGEILYIGKSKRVRTRLLSYFRCVYPEEKGARILREAHTIEWDYTPSEFAALLAELRAIKKFRPRFNVALKRDVRHYAFIKLTRDKAPKMFVVRGPGSSDDASMYYGPFTGARYITESLRELNDIFGLRDCNNDQKMHFSDQPEIFQIARTPGCIRHEIHKCLGPCVAGCSASEYNERVLAARAFLEGSSDAPIALLKQQMEEASAGLKFERAGAYRDKLHRLEALREQFDRLRFAVETLSFIYKVPGYGGDDRVYLIRRGVVRAEVQNPATPEGEEELKRLSNDIFSPIEGPKIPTTAPNSVVPTHEIDELLLLSFWFRKFPDELLNTEKLKV